MSLPQPFQYQGSKRACLVEQCQWTNSLKQPRLAPRGEAVRCGNRDTELALARDGHGLAQTIMNEPEKLIPLHGGYRKLKSFQVAQLAYDVTVRFCDRYIEKRSRTHVRCSGAMSAPVLRASVIDRRYSGSGVQNIAEGSQASGTSKKTELKLTNVARASLEELRLDYEDFLRQHGLTQWPPEQPALMRFKARRCATLAEVRAWVETERSRQTRTDTDRQGRGKAGKLSVSASVKVRERPSVPGSAELAANAALSLLNLACSLLDRQLASLEKAFLEEGGFTERLYRVRSALRK